MLALLLWSCAEDTTTAPSDGRAPVVADGAGLTILFASKGEGEIEPCG